MLLLNTGSNFKDELIATAIVISVTVMGSFFLLSRLVSNATKSKEDTQILGLSNEFSSLSEDVVEPSEPNSPAAVLAPTSTPTSTPTPTPTPSPTPTINLSNVEIPYGSSQKFENDKYIVDFIDPKLTVGASRLFKIKVIIANKNISEGIENKLFGTVSKSGDIISTEAPLTLSETAKIMPGEQLTFTASLSVPEEMTLDRITFKPAENILSTDYNLDPTL